MKDLKGSEGEGRRETVPSDGNQYRMKKPSPSPSGKARPSGPTDWVLGGMGAVADGLFGKPSKKPRAPAMPRPTAAAAAVGESAAVASARLAGAVRTLVERFDIDPYSDFSAK